MIQAQHISEKGTRPLYDVELKDLEGYTLERVEQGEPLPSAVYRAIFLRRDDEQLRIGETAYLRLRKEDPKNPLVQIIDKALGEYSVDRPEFSEEKLRAMRRDTGILD